MHSLPSIAKRIIRRNFAELYNDKALFDKSGNSVLWLGQFKITQTFFFIKTMLNDTRIFNSVLISVIVLSGTIRAKAFKEDLLAVN